MRIPGHGLRSEGAPHDAGGQQIVRWAGYHGGEGRAKCECGAMSDVLPSASARQRWHRDTHKLAVLTERATR